MAVINLTDHKVIRVFPESAFSGLEQKNATLFVADKVDESQLIVEYPKHGMIARIGISVEEAGFVDGKVPLVKTTYGKLEGVPSNIKPNDTLFVSLPTASMSRSAGHPLADQMVSPYKVVRLRSDTQVVLGCMGFTRQ